MKNFSSFFKIFEKKFFFIFSSIAFKIALEFTYINFIVPIYGYFGFNLDISFIKYVESWLIYLAFLSFTPHILEKSSDFVINYLFFGFLTPLIVFYSFTNATRQHLYIVLLGIFLIYLFREFKKIKFPNIKYGHLYAYLLCALGILSTSLWFVFSGGLNFINLDFNKVYEIRRDVGPVINVGFMSYLNIWAYKVFGPVSLIIFFYSRMYFFALLIFLLHLFWFGVSNNKAILFYPFVILFIFIWFRNNKALSIIPVSFTLIVSISYLIFTIFDNEWYASLIVRRTFFVPSFLTFTYYEFFSLRDFIFWSDSITSKFIEYPYHLNPAKLIGEYIGTEAHASNSFLSTGYMHAGTLGVIFYSIIFTFILRLFDSAIYNQKFIWISVAAMIIPIRVLIEGTDLATGLLTHGVLLSLLLLILLKNKFKK